MLMLVIARYAHCTRRFWPKSRPEFEHPLVTPVGQPLAHARHDLRASTPRTPGLLNIPSNPPTGLKWECRLCRLQTQPSGRA